MKRILKTISYISLILFALSWIFDKFNILSEFNSIEIGNIFIVLYLFASLKYFQLELKDKKAEIKDLKAKLLQAYQNEL